MPTTQEFWAASPTESAALQAGIGVDVAALQAPWQEAVGAVLAQATLQPGSAQGYLTRGKQGQHSEHLSYLLAELQSLAREHPEGVW